MTLPNFLVIGAAKAGTTSLYKYLEEHPEVFVSPQKEPRFFAVLSDFEGVVGDDPDQKELWSDSVTTLEEYAALFEGVQEEKAVGEASPIYLWSEEAPKNIKEYVPDVKLIAILRQPVDRAFSHYLHNVKIGLEKNPTFEEALEDDARRHYAEYLRQGLYFRQLSRYYKRFPAEQIKVFIFAEMVADPESTVHSLFQFLEVDDTFTPDIRKIHNPSGLTKSKFVERLLTNPISQTILQAALSAKMKASVEEFVRRKNSYKPKISLKTAQRLQAYYKDDILALQELIGMDLGFWLKKYETLPH